MSQEIINVGATPNDGSGDPLRTAYIKCNNNFSQLFATSALPPKIANGASSVNIPNTDGNIQITVNDVANTVLITQIGTYVTGFMSATGNISGSNLALSGLATVTGNVQAGNLRTAGQLSVTGNISGGNLSATGNISAVAYSGSSLSTTGNVKAGNLLSLGQISASGNISAGAGKFIFGDGGYLSNITVTSNVAVTQIANGSSIIAITDTNGNGAVTINGAGVATFISTGQLISGILSVSGTVTGGNLATSGVCQATGNVTGGNINTVGIVSSGGNVQAGNLRTSGLVSATGNIDAGNLRTSGLVSATGTITAGGLLTVGDVSSAGNITGSYIFGNGSQLTGVSNYGNANVVANLAALGSNPISTTGNVTAGYFIGNGSTLTSLTGANITGTVANATYATSAGSATTATSATTAATVTGNAQANITSVGTLTSLNSGTISSSGNITGANLITGGLVTVTGNVTAGNLSVGSGTITLNNIINGGTSATGNIGTSATPFNTMFAKATSAQYADLAEYYTSDADYNPGTVVKFGGKFETTIASIDSDPEIAGVVSTCPAYVMNTGIEGEYTIAIALQGRVPCKVRGPVRKGQMMVSAGNGYARAELTPQIGSVIGKALADFDGEQGVIEVVVGRL